MVDQLPPIKTLELDKICRVCLTVKKDMRPLFGEMIAELLMECARIQVMDTGVFFICFVGSTLSELGCLYRYNG